MRKSFRFANKDYALEVQSPVETGGDFRKCVGSVNYDGKQRQGIFKLTQPAWDLAGRLAQQQSRPIEEILAEGGVAALKAELYIRQIPEGFSYVVDHRFFEDL